MANNLSVSNKAQEKVSKTNNSDSKKSTNSANVSFIDIINNQDSKSQANFGETKASQSFNFTNNKVEPSKVTKATKQIISEIKKEISNSQQDKDSQTTSKTKNEESQKTTNENLTSQKNSSEKNVKIEDKTQSESKIDKSAPITVEEEEKNSQDEEINYLVLSEIKNKINTEIQVVYDQIAKIDINTPEGVNQILDLSAELEILGKIDESVTKKMEVIDLPYKDLLSLDDIQFETKASEVINLEDQSKNTLELNVEQFDKNKVKDEISKSVGYLIGSEMNKIIENKIYREYGIKISLPSVEDLPKDLDPTKYLLGKVDDEEIEILNIKAKRLIIDPDLFKKLNDQERILTIDDDMSEDMEITGSEEATIIPNMDEGFGSEMSDMEADSFNQQAQGDTSQLVQVSNAGIKNTDIFKVNSKIQIHKNPVSLNELPNTITREATKVTPGSKQEITMSLSPGDLGQIELSISRGADNKLEIKMVFTQDNAMNTVENKLTELRTILRSRGFEAQIELSKSESTSTDNFNRPGQDSFNEAREEQKERIMDTMPAWLRPDDLLNSTSFKSTLQQII
jgi:hypothetical protein